MPFKLSFLTLMFCLNFLLPNFAQEPIILRHGGSVETVKFSPVDTSLLASAGDSHTLKIWDLRENLVTTFRGHTDQINSVAFSPDGRLLVSGGDDWTFRVWDVAAGTHIATLEHVTDRTKSQIKEVAFSPDGELLATAGGHVKLWDIRTQNELATLQHDEYVWALAFSPNGELLAAGDDEGTVKIWDVQERDVIAQLEGDTVSVYALVFSSDGRTLASAGYQGLIKLWAVSDWTLLGTLENSGTAFDLDFAPDGKALASTGQVAVTLWSVESGEEIASLTGHDGWVRGVDFASDGKTLASAGDDGIVRVQNIESYLQTLQQRERVRLIYFLPMNRRAQQDIDTKLDTLIKDVQQFYAEEMQRHGFGRKTFTFETDATGKAVVHHVNGRFRDAYYDNETSDKVTEEIEGRFDTSKNIYLIVVDISGETIKSGEGKNVCGVGGGGWKGDKMEIWRWDIGGHAIISASSGCFRTETAAHELGHAFRLEHDFRDDAYMMSYGTDRDQLSFCAAEWLDVHRYFNTHQTSFNEPATLTMLTPLALPPNALHLRFEATDVDGLHQAQLIIPTVINDPSDGVKLHSCQALDSEISRIEFTTTEVTPGFATEVTLQVIDAYGNIARQTYPLRVDSIAEIDVNSDGVVNVDDLVFIAARFGSTAVRGAHPNPDVNNDGFVNREDLLLVVEALESQENTTAAPSLTAANLQQWILEAKRRNLGDETFQSGIAVLESLVTSSHPTETTLLPNYPNPFNPETWIPYQLATPADVHISIYAADGPLIRRLELGYQPVGVYESRNRAAYWDGRNALGEPVASGVYFYTLTAGDFTATRRMLILK